MRSPGCGLEAPGFRVAGVRVSCLRGCSPMNMLHLFRACVRPRAFFRRIRMRSRVLDVDGHGDVISLQPWSEARAFQAACQMARVCPSNPSRTLHRRRRSSCCLSLRVTTKRSQPCRSAKFEPQIPRCSGVFLAARRWHGHGGIRPRNPKETKK